MKNTADILCIGSVLWDVIGRSPTQMRVGSDVPGRITRLPGGVALNIAMTVRRFDMVPALLSAIGQDSEGRELIAACQQMGMITDHLHLSENWPTDRYMAVEGAGGLIAAIADAHTLEAAGDKILAPLEDGTLGSAHQPFAGLVALDGNLTVDLLKEISARPSFGAADLRVAPASPGKAKRLLPLMAHPGATLYVNLEEAGLICGRAFTTATDGAKGLLDQGATRVLVTNGAQGAADGSADHMLTAIPPRVAPRRITGAGDTFMAAHIAAELKGALPQDALSGALNAAATYVSGEDPA